MKTEPITPAGNDIGSEPGTLAQARHRFLHGSGLPQRWAGRDRFVVLETSFGLGHNFIATWDAWRTDPKRCERLHYVAIERHPPTHAGLATAHADSELPALCAALLQAWPPLTPNLHGLDFDGGRVQLTLALGDLAALLPALRLSADVIFLNGVASTHNPRGASLHTMKAIARRAAPDATVTNRDGTRAIELARHAPHQQVRALPSPSVRTHDAVVVGAGLAGAAAAQALARQGVAVTVLERSATPASGASGNAAGLFHGTVHVGDGRHARLFRAAALMAAQVYGQAMASGCVAGSAAGLLRMATDGTTFEDLQAQAQTLGLPADHVRAVGPAQASALAGLVLTRPAWHFPQGGWLAPTDWVNAALREPGVQLRTHSAVETLVRDGDAWLLLDASAQPLARSRLVVLAQAADTARLLAALGHAPWPLRSVRGQVTQWADGTPTALRLPVTGDGYAIPLPAGLLCGATRQPDDGDAEVRDSDHQHNLARLQSLTGLTPPAGALQGRVGWRLETDDRLPIAGGMPQSTLAPGSRQDQARLLPREDGLFVLTALGSRGLTLAPLLGRLVAAMATGTPWPLEQDLCDAVDPARWLVRAARRQQGLAGSQAGSQAVSQAG